MRASQALQLLKRTPVRVPGIKVKHSPRQHIAEQEKRALLCKACEHVITTDEERMSIGGQHVYTRVNPGGFEYTFACFREAPGCREVGAPSYEHTWFAGHSWRIAVCAGCGEHLGWHFRNGDVFYGLIRDRLVEKTNR